ncbi:putative sigma-24 [Cystobacter fuscus DSM 2262]|uniref:Sigma-24 n=1 Tax=Cystobacter fuscus (strain ATCC 25194 / DSM 2262 / NBRC 100088 / M29) TaxID=1242864 RepID=S9P247_CYSF2|nr:sigma-70 family RNA polymerase sigma factor [Cystobacter fuscus]EPX57191.1 putative sigma-24 [Cystobacter fuscus DSM 2262]
MEPSARQALEQRIRELCMRGETGLAVQAALEGYGPEFMRLMGSILHDREQAREAYSSLAESLLTALPAFRWDCSFRTWAYQVARHVAYRMIASPAAREQPASLGVLRDEAQPEPSLPKPWLQSSVKERFRVLREQLSPHERTLLELRVDRRMSWHDVARAISGPDEFPSREALDRKAAVLRQQFRRIKERLKELARQAEMLSSEEQAPL